MCPQRTSKHGGGVCVSLWSWKLCCWGWSLQENAWWPRLETVRRTTRSCCYVCQVLCELYSRERQPPWYDDYCCCRPVTGTPWNFRFLVWEGTRASVGVPSTQSMHCGCKALKRSAGWVWDTFLQIVSKNNKLMLMNCCYCNHHISYCCLFSLTGKTQGGFYGDDCDLSKICVWNNKGHFGYFIVI